MARQAGAADKAEIAALKAEVDRRRWGASQRHIS
jgi:hypothetical protein